MKQEVFVIGTDLRELVPYSMAFLGPDYAVTLVEAPDVIKRASELAAKHHAWFLLVLSGDEDTEALERLEQLALTTSMVIDDGQDPLIALAHLIAVAAWETTVPEQFPAPSTLKVEEQYG